jgi:hypothetical protein
MSLKARTSIIVEKHGLKEWKLLFANRDTVTHTFHTVSSSLFSLLVTSSKRPVGGFQLSRSFSRIGNGAMWAANGTVFCEQKYVGLSLL